MAYAFGIFMYDKFKASQHFWTLVDENIDFFWKGVDGKYSVSCGI